MMNLKATSNTKCNSHGKLVDGMVIRPISSPAWQWGAQRRARSSTEAHFISSLHSARL